MAEYTQLDQTLKAALIAEGNPQQAALLTGDVENLTKGQIIDIVNTGNWGGLSLEGILILRKISVMRVKNGQPVFPWNDEEFLNAIPEDLLGIIAY